VVYRRYSPGRNLSDAVSLVRYFNKHNVKCSLSFLPIKKDNSIAIHEEAAEYFRLLDTIKKERLACDVTLKLHQFGVYHNKDVMRTCIHDVVAYAHQLNNFVWIDMEMPETVDDTVALFTELHKQYPNTGIALQAYLKRTENDMKHVLEQKAPIRLVKGFYKAQQFKTWKEVTDNYSHLLHQLLLNSEKPCVATHDPVLIAKAKEIIDRHNLKKKAEFQFFNGVCNDRAIQLAKEGYNVRVYVPYGKVWRFLLHGFSTFDVYHQLQRLFHVKELK
jgi:proline dehydrogenase